MDMSDQKAEFCYDNHLSSSIVAYGLKRHNPEGSAGRFIPSLFGLAPDGVYQADQSLGRWCALTAPFHPYRRAGGLFSVALSLRSPSLDVIQHPALWSSDFPHQLALPRLSFTLI